MRRSALTVLTSVAVLFWFVLSPLVVHAGPWSARRKPGPVNVHGSTRYGPLVHALDQAARVLSRLALQSHANRLEKFKAGRSNPKWRACFRPGFAQRDGAPCHDRACVPGSSQIPHHPRHRDRPEWREYIRQYGSGGRADTHGITHSRPGSA